MIRLQGGLAGLGLDYRYLVRGSKCLQFRLGPGITHPAPGNDNRPGRVLDYRQRLLQLVAVGCLTTQSPYPFFKQGLRIIEGLRLHVLADTDRGGIQQEIISGADDTSMPSDAQVVAAVNQSVAANSVVVAAAGSLPAELHKHWNSDSVVGYHLEYGYSCMGYEIASGVGVKMAEPDREVVVIVGDGSYLMMNSDIATAVSLGLKITIVVLDNRGYSCINRLQMATGGANFNNLLRDTHNKGLADIDLAGHARAMGAQAEKVANIGELKAAVSAASDHDGVQVVAAVNQCVAANTVVVAAAGSLPAELHKHWNSDSVGGYHLEYGYSL